MTTPIIAADESMEAPPVKRFIPAASVAAGSLVTIVPVIASFPLLPPFGLLMVLGWRLMRPAALPLWAPLPLGLFDDLVSGQPVGSAMLLWSLCAIGIDLVDQRMTERDFRLDWLLAAGAIGFCLMIGRMAATPISAHIDTVLLVQIFASIMLYPLIARLIAWLDRKRIAP